jgi:putative alpha-1,2-mannosidase
MNTTKIIFSLAFSAAACGLAADTTPLDLVNPLMGTYNPNGLSKGITIPAVALPFPMNAWTPSTGGSGYDYGRTNMVGFRQRHLHTSRMGDFANIAVMPVFGKLAVTEGDRASVRHEILRDGHGRVRFGLTEQTAGATPHHRALRLKQNAKNYSLAFPAYFALSFAHLALAAADIAALPAALIFLFFVGF